jgi:hypothetical protein
VNVEERALQITMLGRFAFINVVGSAAAVSTDRRTDWRFVSRGARAWSKAQALVSYGEQEEACLSASAYT